MDLENEVKFNNFANPSFISTEIIKELQKSNKRKDIILTILSIIFAMLFGYTLHTFENQEIVAENKTTTTTIEGDSELNTFNGNSTQNNKFGSDN